MLNIINSNNLNQISHELILKNCLNILVVQHTNINTSNIINIQKCSDILLYNKLANTIPIQCTETTKQNTSKTTSKTTLNNTLTVKWPAVKHSNSIMIQINKWWGNNIDLWPESLHICGEMVTATHAKAELICIYFFISEIFEMYTKTNIKKNMKKDY